MSDTKFDPWDPQALALAGQAVDINSTKELALWVDGTALCTAGLRYRALSFSQMTRLAEDFLINTRNVRDNRESEASILHYFEDVNTFVLSLSESTEIGDLRTFRLPDSVPLRMELGDAIRHRRSHRLFTGDPVPLDYLATVIRSAIGKTGEADVELATGQHATLQFRSTPSGGKLFPVELYVAALNVTKLKKSVYRYDAGRDALVEVGEADVVDRLVASISTPEEILSASRANALLLLIAKPWRTMRKYGARGMRFVFMEAGYIAQNIHLACTGLGLASVDCASVYDDEAHEALKMDGLFETLVHIVVFGQK
jgi:SagB-type dehydrogenase family enzyme